MKLKSQVKKQIRGFAAMNPELQRQIASKGGRAVSQKPGHQAEIGRRGGLVTGKMIRMAARAARKGATVK